MTAESSLCRRLCTGPRPKTRCSKRTQSNKDPSPFPPPTSKCALEGLRKIGSGDAAGGGPFLQVDRQPATAFIVGGGAQKECVVWTASFPMRDGGGSTCQRLQGLMLLPGVEAAGVVAWWRGPTERVKSSREAEMIRPAAGRVNCRGRFVVRAASADPAATAAPADTQL
ncbi:hypothetical protein AUP68_08908 [Ilyonectria robusta]